MRQTIADQHTFLLDFTQLLVLTREIRSVGEMPSILLLQGTRPVHRHFHLPVHIMMRRIIHATHMLVRQPAL